jgi:hypothetical protein
MMLRAISPKKLRARILDGLTLEMTEGGTFSVRLNLIVLGRIEQRSDGW